MLLSKKRKNNRILANAILIALAFLFHKFTIAQSECKPREVPFKVGEQLNYDAYYNLKKLWVPAGKVRFEVKDSMYNGKECFHFDGKGKTLKKYDYFFKVRDKYGSVVEKSSFTPQRFVRQVNEGGFKLYYDYRFDNENRKAEVILNRKDTNKRTTIDFPECTYDVITAVYYARTLFFEGLEINDTIPIPMMVDKEVYNNVFVRFTGRTRYKANNGHVYNVIKFRPLLIEGTIFEEGEYMEVYVTDDRNHIPIYVEAEILVGSVKAYLTSFKNLKYPLDARIK